MRYILGGIMVAISCHAYSGCMSFDDGRFELQGVVGDEIAVTLYDEKLDGWIFKLNKAACFEKIGTTTEIVIVPVSPIDRTDRSFLETGQQYQIRGDSFEVDPPVQGIQAGLVFIQWMEL